MSALRDWIQFIYPTGETGAPTSWSRSVSSVGRNINCRNENGLFSRDRPNCVLGDRGYDAAAIRRGLRTRHIVPLLAMRRTAHGSGLGRWRWVVERTFAWLSQFRRLRVRYDKRADIHEAFLSLGCALICWQSLRKTWRTA
jgi:DDE family transposase